MKRFVAIVDGRVYGFFLNEDAALLFIKEDFPVAYRQQRYDILPFEDVK